MGFERIEEDTLYCPHCGSTHLVTNKKGFSGGKALTGAVLAGGIGLLAGCIGSNKIKITCLSCGKKCNISDLRHTPLTYEKTGYKSISSNDNKNSPEVDSSILLLLGVLFVILLSIIIISYLFS